MTECLRRYYERLKMEPCLVCGKYGVDIAHLRPVSLKARDWSVRSHKDSRAYTAIPLCKTHHDHVHHAGEKWLDEVLPGGRAFAYAWALRVLGEVCDEG
ncbi:MAG: hypothetical protein GXN93_03815 [Candidatus Diapherotrites archaeon]|nr:hypothetical protein [Candidatus Diapherotrites archaeon]